MLHHMKYISNVTATVGVESLHFV